MADSGTATNTGALYGRLVGPLLSRDDGADAEQLSQLTLTALAQA
ncbi:MAG: dihydroorotate dehydrogenase (quinone), partial [Cyanobacteria bacterium M_DeepCast_100m_m1_067]|nr:dihydroorotate dehydrogenase (quinone) [Cyanobacteria bacterium M_DeepCast_100m_m1_067]